MTLTETLVRGTAARPPVSPDRLPSSKDATEETAHIQCDVTVAMVFLPASHSPKSNNEPLLVRCLRAPSP
ncbi:hypothetical protein J2Z19_001229 [Ensifer adhaerens]|uniref:Uncharacterized protein n=1 Tax=Ensifer adhaerens TaxID=106592 RepID=A0ACC5SRM0_ENSAD|nr:hypothetical protein [Ensifer adhaerens]